MAEEQEKELPYIEFVKQLYVEQGFYHITPLHDGRMAGSPRCEHYFGIYNPDNKGHREIKIDTNGGELDKIAELENGNLVVSSRHDKKIRLYSIAEESYKFLGEAPCSNRETVALSNNRVAVYDDSRTIEIYDCNLPLKEKPIMTLNADTEIKCILELKGQNKLCIANGTFLHVFDLSDGKLLFKIEDIADFDCRSIEQVDDERVILSASFGRVILVNVKEGKVLLIKKFTEKQYEGIRTILKMKDDIFLVGLDDKLAFLNIKTFTWRDAGNLARATKFQFFDEKYLFVIVGDECYLYEYHL